MRSESPNFTGERNSALVFTVGVPSCFFIRKSAKRSSSLPNVPTTAEAGMPEGVVNFVCGPGAEVGEYLLTHPDVDAASFTGSCAAGERLERLLAPLHRPMALEMGGKNAIIVMDDADLELALEGALWGGFGTSGQRCTAASRIIVHDRVYDRFVGLLAEKAGALRLGNGLDAKTQVGPLINVSQGEKILDYIRIGREEGATLLTGGNRVMDGELAHGFFIAPTVFAGVTPEMRIANEEIFGPVVSGPALPRPPAVAPAAAADPTAHALH